MVLPIIGQVVQLPSSKYHTTTDQIEYTTYVLSVDSIYVLLTGTSGVLTVCTITILSVGISVLPLGIMVLLTGTTCVVPTSASGLLSG